MTYQIIRVQRNQGNFVPTGQQNEVSYDNLMLHVVYKDVDGKNSVDRIKVKTQDVVKVYPQYVELEGHYVDLGFDYTGKLQTIAVVK